MFSKLFSSRIIAICVLFAFIFVITLSSCTSPRSVGYNLKSKKKPIATKNINQNSQNTDAKANEKDFVNGEFASDELLDADKKSNLDNTNLDNTNFDNYQTNTANSNDSRLPTLREQMQYITERQDVIEDDISVIKNELTNIKAELVQIKQNLNNQGKTVDSPIITGDQNEKRNLKTNEPKSIDKIAMEETFFESDEVVGTNTPETKKVTTNHKPKKKIRKAQPQKTESTKKTGINTNTKPENEVTPTEASQIPTTEPKVLTQAETQVKLAEDLINQGKIDDAKKIYKNIIKENPKSALVPIAKKKLQQL